MKLFVIREIDFIELDTSNCRKSLFCLELIELKH